ncbi:U-box domain-containing protein 9-like [Cucumis melo var. makuwa]|uniref:RING-type E3 ubiquitin transferase n=2 Tax=Cucumis melo TaxID=3656 RepID=A0A5A7UZN6_CUCMM|nr:U-box domain-containing protein 9-like [Cucumis melo var. makuwa]TYK28671.1 U-box domain-containing protein 9-like [Cucumis melo var. makuwa]
MAMDLLKKDLKQVLYRIIQEEDFDSSAADDAIQILTSLKFSLMPAPSSQESPGCSGSKTLIIPDKFRCPISGDLMKDPVLLITGQTYDRFFIEKWFHEGHNTCPQTKEVLTDMTLTPNRLLRSMISQWCLDNRFELPRLSYEEEVDNVTESHLDALLNRLMSSSLIVKKEAAKELRETTRCSHEFRALFAKLPGSVERLLHPLISIGKVDLHPDLQEDLITTILNISVFDDNKEHVVENPLVLPLLIESLQHGSIELTANAVAAIYSLSFSEANKITMGKVGIFKHLISLLDYAHPGVTRDAGSAIYNLCTTVENREKAVGSGVVAAIFRNIARSLLLVDKLISILALLCTDVKAIDEMCKFDVVPCMLRFIRETESQRIKENCASILFAICTTDQSQLRKIQEDENKNETILELSKNGNSRASRKATGILERMQRAASRTHTS